MEAECAVLLTNIQSVEEYWTDPRSNILEIMLAR